jgi:hypothetical protein
MDADEECVLSLSASICVNLRAIPDSAAFCRLDRLGTGAFNAKAQRGKPQPNDFPFGYRLTFQCAGSFGRAAPGLGLEKSGSAIRFE